MVFKDFKELYAFLRGKFVEVEPKEYVEEEKAKKPSRKKKKEE